MADLVNPYANPYLPSFVNQRPRMNDFKPISVPQIPTVSMPSYKQIASVNGYAGAREFVANNLAPGSSDIIAESDPNTARVYIVAKDQNGVTIVEGYRLIHEEEPKPITMDDLNAKMSELLDRMNKLEGEKHNADDESGNEPVVQGFSANQDAPKSRSGSSRSNQSSGNSSTNDAK